MVRLALCLLVAFACAAPAQDEELDDKLEVLRRFAPEPDSSLVEQIDRLIDDLGHADFATRFHADQELRALGIEAVALLVQRQSEGSSAEQSFRIEAILNGMADAMSVRSTFYRNHRLRSQALYLHDVLWGECAYHENGRMRELKPRRDGKKHGDWKLWFESGQLEESFSYVDDKLEGVSRKWYENGQLAQESLYRDGLLEGPSRAWYEDGSPRLEIEFRAGLRHGLAKWWKEDGRLVEKRYEEGRPVE